MGQEEKSYRLLSLDELNRVADEVKLMLHAHRDCLRNQGFDTNELTFKVNDGYYGEAFGVMRGLHVLGYGYFGASNVPHPKRPYWNLKWWFSELEQRVLEEENFRGSNYCDHCLQRYGHDYGRILDRATGQIRAVRRPNLNMDIEDKPTSPCR